MQAYMQSPQGFVFHTSNPEYHAECTRLSAKDGKAAELRQSLEMLHSIIKPGDTVYTVLRHVSKSGMMRRIDLYAIVDNRPVYLSGHAAHVLGYPDPKDGIAVTGCGMDMGFHLVYNLGRAMWPHGTQTPHGTRNGQPDTDGGYALNHQWI